MKPQAFLKLAKQLSSNTSCEASLRSCVSRSYYALFNFMSQFIENNNVVSLSHTAEDHTKVKRYFYHCGVEEIEVVASSLDDLRIERNSSDYKMQVNKFTPNTVALLYKKAEIAFDSFERTIKNSVKRKKILKGIQQYRQKTNS